VFAYNKDECNAAAALRDWLEALRAELVAGGANVPRPVPGDSAPTKRLPTG